MRWRRFLLQGEHVNSGNLHTLMGRRSFCNGSHDALIKKLSSWRHSGFRIHHQVRIDDRDQDRREKLAQYILRAPVSLQKIRYHATSRTVIYRSKMHRVLTRNFEVFPVLDWIAAATAHNRPGRG